LLHLRQSLPPQCLEPSHQEIDNARPRLVGPEPIELLAQHIRFEQSAIRGEQGLEFGALRSADRLPASEQQPALAATVLAHHGSRSKELLAPHFIERRARVLEHVEFVEDDFGAPPSTRRMSQGMRLTPRRPDGFGLLLRNLRHLRGNDLPSPVPFYENAQVAESSTNRIPLYTRAGLGYGYVSVDLNCDLIQFV
jgi:hypothetical protein